MEKDPTAMQFDKPVPFDRGCQVGEVLIESRKQLRSGNVAAGEGQ